MRKQTTLFWHINWINIPIKTGGAMQRLICWRLYKYSLQSKGTTAQLICFWKTLLKNFTGSIASSPHECSWVLMSQLSLWQRSLFFNGPRSMILLNGTPPNKSDLYDNSGSRIRSAGTPIARHCTLVKQSMNFHFQSRIYQLWHYKVILKDSDAVT